jgi:hypothetical protein
MEIDNFAKKPLASDVAIRLHLSHVESLRPLQERAVHLRARADAERRRIERAFPASIEDYHALRHEDHRRRVALYLVADSDRRSRLLDENEWAWRQTKALADEYERNVGELVS